MLWAWAILVHYVSWRQRDPDILGVSLCQQKELCWAIGLIRQLEIRLKMEGVLRRDKSLSIQELVNLIDKSHLKDDGTIKELEYATEAMKHGTVEGDLCPLTYSLQSKRFYDDNVIRYKVKDMTVCYLAECDDEFLFEYRIEKLLQEAPLAVGIRWYPSYLDNNGRDIYNPSQEEQSAAKKEYGHLMLLTGYGIDDKNVPFWEFYDSSGTDWGDSGFVRVARECGLVSAYVKLTI